MSGFGRGRSGSRCVRALAAGAAVLAVAGGSAGSGGTPGRARQPQSGTAAVASAHIETVAATSRVAHRLAKRPSKLLVVVLENRDASQVRAKMPYLSAQATRYGQATRYFGVTHPSLPNYLTMAAGTTFGIRDDRGPGAHHLHGASVFGQALARHRTAATYAEGMKTNCQLRDTGRYAVRHNPWTYFPGERAACRRHDVPAGTPKRGALHHAIAAGRLPTFSLLVPDVCNDAHDCSLKTADRWLRSWLGAVRAGRDWRAGRLAVLVTFDEDDHSAGNHIAAVMLHPSLQHRTVRQRLDHRDLSAGVSHLVGATPLHGAARRPGLLAAFGLA